MLLLNELNTYCSKFTALGIFIGIFMYNKGHLSASVSAIDDGKYAYMRSRFTKYIHTPTQYDTLKFFFEDLSVDTTQGGECSWPGVNCNADMLIEEIDLSEYSLGHERMKRINGTIPTELGNLWQLKSLNLGGLSLTGTLPTELGNLTLLETMSVRANMLTGTIPTEFQDLTSLMYFDIRTNSIGGSIHADLSNLKDLIYLLIGENEFTGTIPTELGSMSSLQFISLEENNLTGTIPNKLTDLDFLQYLDAASNNLMGTIPSEFFALQFLSFLNVSNNDLTGTVSFPCSMNGLNFSHDEEIIEDCSTLAPSPAPPLVTLSPSLVTLSPSSEFNFAAWFWKVVLSILELFQFILDQIVSAVND